MNDKPLYVEDITRARTAQAARWFAVWLLILAGCGTLLGAFIYWVAS